MATKATISSGYRWRLGIIGLVCLGFGLWCLNDGLFKYPEQLRRWEKFNELQKTNPNDWQDPWQQEAKTNDWPTETPESRNHSDIYTQYLMAAIVLPIGLLFGFGFLRAGGRWVASDETGLSASGGKRVGWADIDSVDTSRWKRKGIAVVHYKDDGSERYVTLDDWKFDREATNQIFSDLKENTTDLIAAEDPPPSSDESARVAE